MRKVVGRLTRVWNPHQRRQELFKSQSPEVTGGLTPTDLLALGRRLGLTGGITCRARTMAPSRGGLSHSKGSFRSRTRWAPAAKLDARVADARALTEPEASGFLLRASHICAKPGADPER
jgi:hypothetical protein